MDCYAARAQVVVECSGNHCLPRRFERHLSISDEQRNVALKLFIAQFLNTAMTVQIVNIKPATVLPSIFRQVFRGTGPMFGEDWYGVGGAVVATTVLLGSFTVYIAPVLTHAMSACTRRMAGRNSVAQFQMDAAFAPAPFRIAARVANVLTVVFVSLTYSSALPVMLPIAVLSLFIQFWFDKVCPSLFPLFALIR